MKVNPSGPIVCGTDFSENARQAADIAAVLAVRLGSPLLLVHAHFTVIQTLIPGASGIVPQMQECLRIEAERLREKGAIVEEIFTEGTPSDVLRDLASERNARLVIVSSLGHHGFSHWLIGSVAERTAESSPVPTLVVRESAPFEKWASGEKALQVLVAVDFSSSSDAALRWVGELESIGPCEVTAAFVGWPPEEATRLGIPDYLEMGGSLAEMTDVLERNTSKTKAILERDLREKAIRLLGHENVQIRVCRNWGRADHPLLCVAMETKADLIVVGTHQRHGLNWLREGSISRGVLKNATMSVACIPKPTVSKIVGPRTQKCLRVLVAVDLDEPHGFAAAYAYSIINPGGTVRLVHNYVPSLNLLRPNDSGQRTADFENKLRALIPETSEKSNVTTEVEVTEGWETAEAICTAAERFGADILCIGSHTRPGFTAKVLGSVALAVLQNSRRPVLIVWPPTA